MILSAGKGTRLRPLTLTTPKPLVEVGGQPLIVWHIKALKQAGITDITINVSWLADKLLAALGDGQDFGVNIHWSIEPEEPLETAGGIKKALVDSWLKDEPFILVNGDVWTPFDFSQLVDIDLNDKLAYLLLTDKAPHNPNGDFALSDPTDINVTAQPKLVMAEGSPKYTFAGISVMSPAFFAPIKAGETAPLAPLLKQAMTKNLVIGNLLPDEWVDVGTLERLQRLNEALSEALSNND